jgi:hypothetical protein
MLSFGPARNSNIKTIIEKGRNLKGVLDWELKRDEGLYKWHLPSEDCGGCLTLLLQSLTDALRCKPIDAERHGQNDVGCLMLDGKPCLSNAPTYFQ